MKRSRIKRRTPIKRTGRINPINRQRRARERERAYGPEERREWLTSQPCVACGSAGPIHQHHTKGGGTGRKADCQTTVALCARCHRMHHDGHDLGVDWEAEARRTEAAWQDYQREETTR